MFDGLPNEWQTTSLKHAAGKLFADGDWVESKDQDPDGEVRLIQLADIGDGMFLDKSNRFLTVEKARALGCTFLCPGDLLIARMADPIARCCIFPGLDQPAATVVDVCIARPRADVDRDYLSYAVSSDFFRLQAIGAASGTTRSRISRSHLGMIEFPLPPLDEQRRIAEVLRSVDRTIQNEQKVKEAAEQCLGHILSSLLPASAIEALRPRWSKTTVGVFSNVRTGKTPSTKETSLWGGEIPFVTPTDMDGAMWIKRAQRTVTEFALPHTKVAPKNSVLFTCIASIGKQCIIKVPAAFNQQINACTCANITDAEFLFWTLRNLTPYIKNMCGTTAVPIINKSVFSSLDILVPPPDERAEIVSALTDIQLLIENTIATIDQLIIIKDVLIADLLSGRVRVPA